LNLCLASQFFAPRGKSRQSVERRFIARPLTFSAQSPCLRCLNWRVSSRSALLRIALPAVANMAAFLVGALARLLPTALPALCTWLPGRRQVNAGVLAHPERSSAFKSRASPLPPSVTHKARPNRSLEATSTGVALGPRSARHYHALRGPSATPVAAPQLQRWAS
jgi:hypothetical protein